MLTNLNLTDMEVCYKVFKAGGAAQHPPQATASTLSGVTAKVAKKGYRIYEVPSPTARTTPKARRSMKDGVQAILDHFKYRFTD